MSQPAKIDVLIPLYNNKAYVAQAIRSVLAQTHPVHRILVVDDASTDGAAELVETTFKDNPKVRLIRASKGGVSAARNKGLAEAAGDYVAFLDSDDIWKTNKLERQMSVFAADPEVGVVYCNYDYIDNNGDPVLGAVIYPPKMRGDIFFPLLSGGALSGSASAVVAKRDLLIKAGEFDETMILGEDWDVWLRLARITKFDFVNEQLTLIRRHLKQTQAHDGWDHRLRMSRDHIHMWSKWPIEVSRTPKALMLVRRRMIAPAFSPDMTLLKRIMAPRRIAATLWPEADPALMRAAWGTRFLMILSGTAFIATWFITSRVVGKSKRIGNKILAWLTPNKGTTP